MTFESTSERRLLVKTHGHDLTALERSRMEATLDTLKSVVDDFPVVDLQVDVVRHPRRQDFHVKTSLHLPKQTLFTGDRDVEILPAFERCVSKLVNKVKGYKERLRHRPARQRVAQGTTHDVWPEREPEIERIRLAVARRDFVSFRDAMSVYDDALTARAGRWIQRYPELQARLGRDILVSDLVEEIYLNAFEGFESRPNDRLGNWLERLIDPSLRVLIEQPEERENLGMVEGLSAPRAAGEAG